MDMRFLLQRAEGLETVQVLKVDLAIILAPPPPSFGMRTRIEKQTIGVVSQFGDGMELQGYHFLKVLLLGKVAINAVIADHTGQPVALIVKLLGVEIHARLLLPLVLLRVRFAR